MMPVTPVTIVMIVVATVFVMIFHTIPIVVLQPADVLTGVVTLALQGTALIAIEMPVTPESPFHLGDVTLLLAQGLRLLSCQLAGANTVLDTRVLTIVPALEAVLVPIGQGGPGQQSQQGNQYNGLAEFHGSFLQLQRERLPLARHSRGGN